MKGFEPLEQGALLIVSAVCGRRAAVCLKQETEPLSLFSWAHKGERSVSHIPTAGHISSEGGESSAEAGLIWFTSSGKIYNDRLSPGSKTTTQLVRLSFTRFSLYRRRPVQREISTNRCCSDYRSGIASYYTDGAFYNHEKGKKWQASHFYRYD